MKRTLGGDRSQTTAWTGSPGDPIAQDQTIRGGDACTGDPGMVAFRRWRSKTMCGESINFQHPRPHGFLARPWAATALQTPT